MDFSSSSYHIEVINTLRKSFVIRVKHELLRSVIYSMDTSLDFIFYLQETTHLDNVDLHFTNETKVVDIFVFYFLRTLQLCK